MTVRSKSVPAAGAEGQHPPDRQRRQLGRKTPQRGQGPAVSPLQIIKADHDGLAESSPLQQRLDVLEQPVTLLGRRVRLPEG